MNKERICILLLEDEKSDIALVQHYLEENLDQKIRYRITHKKDEYRKLLKAFTPDVIIADYTMPSFTGMEALKILRSTDDITPFIFLTGTIGEEKAVNALLSGATDFIIKSRIEFLPAAVIRAMKEYRETVKKLETEKKLKQSYQQIKTAQKLAKIGYWEYDFQKSKFRWTDEVFNIWERNSENFVPTAHAVNKTIVGDDIGRLLNPEYELYDRYDQLETEHCIRTPLRKRKWIKNHMFVIKDSNGKAKRLEGAVQDVTEEKETQLKLQLSHDRFQMALKAASEAIWDWDINSKQIYLGQGFEPLLLEEIPEHSQPDTFWHSRIHTDDLQKFKSKITESLFNPEISTYHIEYRIYRANGSIAYVLDRAVIRRDEQKRAERVVGAILDLTETKKLVQEIQQQNEQLREIAWTQSHVVRAPLARILGLIDLLLMDEPDMDARELLRHINDSAKELDQVVREIVAKTKDLKIDKKFKKPDNDTNDNPNLIPSP